MFCFKNKQRTGVVQILSALCFTSTLNAQLVTDPASLSSLTITARTMTVKNQENTAILEGNVVINKGDLTITADHVEIFFGPNDSSSTNDDQSTPTLPGSQFDTREISELHAWGNVMLQQGTRRAEAREAIYDQKDEKITLLGEPVIFEKDYQVTGTKMTFFLKDNRSIVEGSKVLIQPEELQKPQ